MPRIAFTENIQRHLPCPPTEVAADTVRAALEAVFTPNPAARSYVLDDQGALRRHMVIFVNGRPIADRIGLSDAVAPDATIHVMQALSGG